MDRKAVRNIRGLFQK